MIISAINSISEYNNAANALAECREKKERKRLGLLMKEWMQAEEKAGRRYVSWNKKDFN